MKDKLLTLSLVTGLIAPVAYAQQGAGSTNANPGQSGAHLPPGLQNREQLPPGLNQRQELPPGLQNRQGQGQVDTNPNQGIPLRTPSQGRGIGLTNPYVNRSITLTNQTGGARVGVNGQTGGATIGVTNQAGSAQSVVTNQFGLAETNATGVRPTSRPGAEPRLYGTNTSRIDVTNRLEIEYEDEAFSPADERLLIQTRRAVQPIIARITSGATPRVTSEGSAWSPVHFHIRDNVVTLVGYVPTPVVKEQIVATVQQLPGVTRVVDRIEIRAVNSTEVEVQNQGTVGAESSATLSNQFLLSGTNRVGGSTNLAPTSHLTNDNRLYPKTNGTLQPGTTNGANTNLPPTGRDSDRNYGTNNNNNEQQGLPPGLQKRDELPPGLERREQLPPGLQRRQNSTNL